MDMGVRKKGRRVIKYKEHEYVWWVEPYGDDSYKLYLNIISEDKSVILSYRVGDGSFVIPLMIVTPKDVAQIVEWAVDGSNAVRLK